MNLLGGSARNGGLLDDDLGGSGDLGDTSSSELEVADCQRHHFDETHFRSAAKPAPIPDFLVGVLTETKMRLVVSTCSLLSNDRLTRPRR